MVRFYLNRRFLARFCTYRGFTLKAISLYLIVVLVAICFAEWHYYHHTIHDSWPVLPPNIHGFRVLVAPDPQLIGYRGIETFLSRKDSDLFMQNFYTKIVKQYDPKMAVFLGDIFDEGEQMSDSEYAACVERFKYIFSYNEKAIKRIVILGDNDLSEKRDEVDLTTDSVFLKRFYSYFPKGDPQIDIKISKHFKLEFLIWQWMYAKTFQLYPKLDYDNDMTLPLKSQSKRIVFSHWPLVNRRGQRDAAPLLNILPHLKPHLVIAGHKHSMEHNIRQNGKVDQGLTMDLYDFYHATLNLSHITSHGVDANVHEIVLPSVSYRMGNEFMSYGLFDINDIGGHCIVHLYILRLPSRYGQFSIYLDKAYNAFCVVLVLLVIRWVWIRNYLKQPGGFAPERLAKPEQK